MEYSESFNYRIAKVSEDSELIWQEVQEAYINNNHELMGQRGEDLYQSLQKMEKDVALLYTIRRVLHLGITEDRAAADKAMKLQSEALHKEFNNLKD